jgi:hypothetical protein
MVINGLWVSLMSVVHDCVIPSNTSQALITAYLSSSANHHLSKTIELSRIHLFNILTQYRVIFSDDEPILPLPKDQNINETSIFHSWIIEKVKWSCNYFKLWSH